MMRMMLFSVAAVLLLVTSCATTTEREAAREAEEIAGLIRAGDAETLGGITGRPFLFEGEILPSPELVNDLWTGLAGAGLLVDGYREIRLEDPDTGTSRLFGDAWEVEAWFRRHLPPEASLVFIADDEGEIVLILNRNRRDAGRVWGLAEVTP